MKKLLLITALLFLSCSNEDSEDCECRTVTPPELTSSYTYRFCPDVEDLDTFYEKFENTYHPADWWGNGK